MTTDAAVLVSLPGVTLNRLRISGSLFDVHEIRGQLQDDLLEAAIDLIEENAHAAGLTVSLVARPEMYAARAAHDWLRSQAPNAAQHIAISDGTSAGQIAGLENHLFLATQSVAADASNFRRILVMASEYFRQYAGSINCEVPGVPRRSLWRPPREASPPRDARGEDLAWHLYNMGYFRNPENEIRIPTGVGRLGGLLEAFDRVSVLLLTENALYDNEFCVILATEIARHYHMPDHALVIHPPFNANRSAAFISERVRMIYQACESSGIELPPLPAPNIFIVHSTASGAVFDQRNLATIMSTTDFPFWIHRPSDYAGADHLLVWSPSPDPRPTGIDVDFIHDITGVAPHVWSPA